MWPPVLSSLLKRAFIRFTDKMTQDKYQGYRPKFIVIGGAFLVPHGKSFLWPGDSAIILWIT